LAISKGRNSLCHFGGRSARGGDTRPPFRPPSQLAGTEQYWRN
jgi:hypothetical protein